MVPKILAFSLLLCGVAEASNFITYQTSDPERSKQIVNRAEQVWVEIHRAWFGGNPEPLREPCVISWREVNGRGGGATTFEETGPAISSPRMEIFGKWEHLLNDTIPHEVMHLLLRTHLGHRPARWIDEGVATTTESDSLITHYEDELIGYLRDGRVPPINVTLSLSEYPSDVLPFYAQSVSMCRWLIGTYGKDKLIELSHSHNRQASWTAAFREVYGFSSLQEVQDAWLSWVKDGSPDIITKPIPRGQAPYRTTPVCTSGNCILVPSSPRPVPVPVQSGQVAVTPTQPAASGCDCDPEQIAASIVATYGEQLKGDPGQISDEQLAAIVAAVLERVKSDPSFTTVGSSPEVDYDLVVNTIMSRLRELPIELVLRGPNGYEDRDTAYLGGDPLELELFYVGDSNAAR